MNRTAVSSSNLVAVGWEADENDELNGILEVEFKRGQVYQYTGVPSWVYQGLLFAESPGQYFIQQVLNTYDGQRIE